MNKPDAAIAPPSALNAPSRGAQLSMYGAPVGARAISIEMLPAEQGAQLHGVADNLGVGWLDPRNQRLRLQFNIVAIFGNAPVEGFSLAVPGSGDKVALPATRMASPVAAARFADLPWAGQSRYVVDQTVDFVDWPDIAGKCELYADVAGKLEKIGIIHAAPQLGEDRERGDRLAVLNAGPNSEPRQVSQANGTIASRMRDRIRNLSPLFVLTVIVPTLVASVYYGLIASDVYVSESTFVVRGSQPQMMPSLGMMFKGSTFGPSQDDSYAVQNFIMSRDALKGLEKRMNIRAAFSSSKVAIFNRFPGVGWWDNSFESFYSYYKHKVDVEINGTTSIVTLRTRAFTAQDSYKMNQLLLSMSEALVNQLSERGRQDLIDFAAREVGIAQKKDREVTTLLAKMQTGSANVSRGRSLVSKFTEYQRVLMEKDIADKMLSTALTSLEDARNEALRKQLYLERIAEPRMPDKAMEPRRLRGVLATLGLGLIAWGVLTMLITGIREHQD